jgi:hypothetical protein
LAGTKPAGRHFPDPAGPDRSSGFPKNAESANEVTLLFVTDKFEVLFIAFSNVTGSFLSIYDLDNFPLHINSLYIVPGSSVFTGSNLPGLDSNIFYPEIEPVGSDSTSSIQYREQEKSISFPISDYEASNALSSVRSVRPYSRP